MPTKAQLEEQLMCMISDAEHLRRKYDERIEDLEDQICKLSALRGACKPYFIPSGSTPMVTEGTAHCPVCEAVTPATLHMAAWGNPVIATVRHIEHKKSCIFAVQNKETP